MDVKGKVPDDNSTSGEIRKEVTVSYLGMPLIVKKYDNFFQSSL